MEKKMEAAIVYWGFLGIMEKKMEATIVYWGFRTWLSERELREIGHGVAELEVYWGQTASEGGHRLPPPLVSLLAYILQQAA